MPASAPARAAGSRRRPLTSAPLRRRDRKNSTFARGSAPSEGNRVVSRHRKGTRDAKNIGGSLGGVIVKRPAANSPECGRHVRLPSVDAKSDQRDGGKKRARAECDQLQAPEQVELLGGAAAARRAAVVAVALPIRHAGAHRDEQLA
eukprot:scaffold81430_cov68-Phaeocystis_antarctica.AAC.2